MLQHFVTKLPKHKHKRCLLENTRHQSLLKPVLSYLPHSSLTADLLRGLTTIIFTSTTPKSRTITITVRKKERSTSKAGAARYLGHEQVAPTIGISPYRSRILEIKFVRKEFLNCRGVRLISAKKTDPNFIKEIVRITASCPCGAARKFLFFLQRLA